MPSTASRSARGAAAYRALALLALNSVVVFVLMNACSVALLHLGDNAGALDYGIERLEQVYPGRSADEIRSLLRETWSREYVYEPFTQFREDEVSGDYVNVAPDGFRSSGMPQPWPPPADRQVVFVFGGSTTFGYGLADDETIPATVGRDLRRQCPHPPEVYNFARSNYYSSQELVLFERLLARGHAPDVAVFVDGLNEFGYPSDAPKFTRTLAHLMNESSAATARRFVVDLPLARLIKKWTRGPESSRAPVSDPTVHETIVDRWLRNRDLARAAAGVHDTAVLHVWQPIPTYNYDPASHLFLDEVTAEEEVAVRGYNLLARRLEAAAEPAPDVLWLADLQAQRDEPLYVDRVHYTATFSADIADRITAALTPRLCASGGDATEASTPGG